jgi:hypothetical protein
VKPQSNKRVAVTEEKKPEVIIAPDINDTLKKVVDTAKSSANGSTAIEEKKPEVASTPAVTKGSKENIIDNKNNQIWLNKRYINEYAKAPESYGQYEKGPNRAHQ